MWRQFAMFDYSEDEAVDKLMGDLLSIAKFLFLLLWALVGGLAALLIKNTQIKPEAKLRQLGPSGHWGALIEAVQCPACDTLNEPGTGVCYFCGYSLGTSSANQANTAGPITASSVKIALGTLLLLMAISLLDPRLALVTFVLLLLFLVVLLYSWFHFVRSS
jgi:hypothetical protein